MAYKISRQGLSTSQVALELGVTPRQVRNLVEAGLLRAKKFGRRALSITPGSVEKYKEQRKLNEAIKPKPAKGPAEHEWVIRVGFTRDVSLDAHEKLTEWVMRAWALSSAERQFAFAKEITAVEADWNPHFVRKDLAENPRVPDPKIKGGHWY
jgi:hypothetical protein